LINHCQKNHIILSFFISTTPFLPNEKIIKRNQ